MYMCVYECVSLNPVQDSSVFGGLVGIYSYGLELRRRGFKSRPRQLSDFSIIHCFALDVCICFALFLFSCLPLS